MAAALRRGLGRPRSPAAGKLFVADASYHEMPFDAPKQGRAAIEDAGATSPPNNAT